MKRILKACSLPLVLIMSAVPVLALDDPGLQNSGDYGEILMKTVMGLVFIAVGGGWLYFIRRKNVCFFVGKKEHKRLYLKPQDQIIIDVAQDISPDKSLIIVFKKTLVKMIKEVVIMNGPRELSRCFTAGKEGHLEFKYDPENNKTRWK